MPNQTFVKVVPRLFTRKEELFLRMAHCKLADILIYSFTTNKKSKLCVSKAHDKFSGVAHWKSEHLVLILIDVQR